MEKKFSLEKNRERGYEKLKKVHSMLRIVSIAAYAVVFASWFFLRYSLVILAAAIAAILIIRVLVSIWLFKTSFPGKKTRNKEKGIIT